MADEFANPKQKGAEFRHAVSVSVSFSVDVNLNVNLRFWRQLQLAFITLFPKQSAGLKKGTRYTEKNQLQSRKINIRIFIYYILLYLYCICKCNTDI